MPSYSDVAHLLRRAGFGGTASEINALTPLTLTQVVDKVLDTTATPAIVMPTEINHDGNYWNAFGAHLHWMFDRMRTTPVPIAEKMTVFWHGHFPSEIDKVVSPRLMWDQQHLFRTAGLGSFTALVHAMSLQPAMLIYLDNRYNTADYPNENFGRELLELFTIGVGNYTQADVVAVSRAWTGYGLTNDELSYEYHAGDHDNGLKTFFGKTQAWTGPQTIDEILLGPKQPIAARYIANKLWEFFAYRQPETAVSDAITTAFISSGLNIKALLKAIFLRSEFYSTKAKQGMIRGPIDWTAAALKCMQMPAADVNPDWWLRDLGQCPWFPPNVAGWDGNEAWISTGAFWAKANAVGHLAYMGNANGVLSGSGTLSVPTAVQRAFDIFGINEPTAATRADLEAFVTAERADGGWHEQRNLIALTLLSPEFGRA